MSSISWSLASNPGTPVAWSAPDWYAGTTTTPVPGGPVRGDDVTMTSSGTLEYSTGSLYLNSFEANQGGVSGGVLDMAGGTLVVQDGYGFGDTQGGLMVGGGLLRLVSTGNDQLGSVVTQTAGTLTLVGGESAGTNGSSSGNFTQTGGTLNILRGIFSDNEANSSFSGTVAGGGDFQLSSGNATFGLITGGSHPTTTALTLDVADTIIGNASVLLETTTNDAQHFQLTQGGTLNLNGNILDLTGISSLYGTITNGGTIADTGFSALNGLQLDEGASILIGSSAHGTAALTGNITLGSLGSGTLDVASSGTLRLVNNSAIQDGNSGGTMINSGLIIKTGGGSIAGTSAIATPINSTGTIDAAVGTIEFDGPSNNALVSTLTGTISGAGTIAFGTGFYELNVTALTAAEVVIDEANSSIVTLGVQSPPGDPAGTLSYGGLWEQESGITLIYDNLTFTGTTALDGGNDKGTATLTTDGALHLGANNLDIEGNLTINMNGPVTQTGQISLGADVGASVDQAVLAAGNSWALEGTADISGQAGTITNHGLFEKLNGSSISTVQSDFNNTSTGTIMVDSGTLSLTGQGILGGVVGGSAALDIDGNFTLNSGLVLSVGEVIMDTNADATLAGNLAYANGWASEGGTLNLGTNTLTLTGTTSLLSGAIAGPGEVILGGPTVLGTANGNVFSLSADLAINGHVEQAGNVGISNTNVATVVTIDAGGSVTMDSGASGAGTLQFGNQANTGSLVLAAASGSVAAAALTESGGGTTAIYTNIIDNGAITVGYGEMQFMGSLGGAGGLTILHGGVLDFDFNGSTSNGVTFGAGGGELSIGNNATDLGVIHNFGSGDLIEFQGNVFSTTGTPATSDTLTLATNGLSAVISVGSQTVETVYFATAQMAANLTLGEGSHNDLALIHL